MENASARIYFFIPPFTHVTAYNILKIGARQNLLFVGLLFDIVKKSNTYLHEKLIWSCRIMCTFGTAYISMNYFPHSSFLIIFVYKLLLYLDPSLILTENQRLRERFWVPFLCYDKMSRVYLTTLKSRHFYFKMFKYITYQNRQQLL